MRLFGVITERLLLLLCKPAAYAEMMLLLCKLAANAAEMLLLLCKPAANAEMLLLLCKPGTSGAAWRKPYIIEPTLLVRQRRRGVEMVIIPTGRLMAAADGIRAEPFLGSRARSGRWSPPSPRKIGRAEKGPSILLPFSSITSLLPVFWFILL